MKPITEQVIQQFIEEWNQKCRFGRPIAPIRKYGKPAMMIRDTSYKTATQIAAAMIEEKPELLSLIS